MSSTSKPHRFRDQLFWAEGGLICIENQKTGEFKVIKRLDATLRAIALNAELAFTEYPSDRDELMRCVVALCEAVKEARRQGDPSNPEVAMQKIKDARKTSLITGSPSNPSDISVANLYKGMEGTVLPSHEEKYKDLADNL
jgi:hypothetical protein